MAQLDDSLEPLLLFQDNGRVGRIKPTKEAGESGRHPQTRIGNILADLDKDIV